MKNNTSFYEEQHVVFRRHFLIDWEVPQIGHFYENLKINSDFWQTQPQDKKAMAKEFDAQLFLDIQDEAGNYARTARTTRE